MPASKRRLAEARAAQRARESQNPDVAEAAVQPGPGVASVAAPAAAAAEPSGRPARTRYVETDPAYVSWPRTALMALLAMVFLAQVVIGLAQHFIWHRTRLVWIDLFFPNAFLLLIATVVLAPLVKRLLTLPRHLRWLESLSLGAVYALIVTLLSLTLIHPVYPNTVKTPSADDLMNALGNGDVPGLVIADTFGILFAAQIFPGLSRLITAPGRRAKARLEEKQRAARKGGGGAARGRTAASRPSRVSAGRATPKGRG